MFIVGYLSLSGSQFRRGDGALKYFQEMVNVRNDPFGNYGYVLGGGPG